MIVNTNLTVFVWTIVVSAQYFHNVVAHGDSTHSHSSDEKSIDHADDHHHHHSHFHHHGSVDSSRVRSRKLVNDIINTTVSKTDIGRCGTSDPSPEMMAESSRIVKKWMESPNSRQTDRKSVV